MISPLVVSMDKIDPVSSRSSTFVTDNSSVDVMLVVADEVESSYDALSRVDKNNDLFLL